jgi:hypothetical protein
VKSVIRAPVGDARWVNQLQAWGAVEFDGDAAAHESTLEDNRGPARWKHRLYDVLGTVLKGKWSGTILPRKIFENISLESSACCAHSFEDR